MTVADQPAGLMDIASSLSQDEIPFKLRCAICNKLAVNAFRLPCCDQAICEHCQASLPESCPVCAHTPISPDLCKPNKALRTTLKAFLRTEEKKREKQRPSTTPATPTIATPVDGTPAQADAQTTPVVAAEIAVTEDSSKAPPSVDGKPEEPAPETAHPDEAATTVADANSDVQAEAQTQEPNGVPAAEGAGENGTAAEVETSHQAGEAADADQTEGPQQGMLQFPGSAQMMPNAMGLDMSAGGFPNIGWNGAGDLNSMAQFMPNGMFNFQQSMGMPGMAVDPMAASQGMFGGYGMNMNGMNMGMNFNAGQGMYGGWDGSQNIIWNGSQDKFNPNAFANGMGPEFGGPSGFGGYNMSQPHGNYQMQQQFPNQDFQNGFYGPGYGRGAGRSRGRGFFQGGRGRGGFGGHMQANYSAHTNYPAFQNQQSPNVDQQNGLQAQQDVPGELELVTPSAADIKKFNDDLAPGGENELNEDLPKETTDETAGEAKDMPSEAKPAEAPPAEQAPAEEPELRGIPTIDSIDQASHDPAIPSGPAGFAGPMGPGFGRGGLPMRGGYPGGRGGGFTNGFMPGAHQAMPPTAPRGQGVAGAPAAPRAMREGLPNTGIRGRGFQIQGRASMLVQKPSEGSRSATPTTRQAESRPRSKSRSGSRARSRSGSRSRGTSRSRSPSGNHSRSHRRHRHRSESAYASDEDRERRRERHRKRSRREDEEDLSPIEEKGTRSRSQSLESSRRLSHRRDRDRDRRRSHRSRRHRSRTRSPDRKESVAPEANGTDSRDKASVSGDLSSRITSSHRSGKERSSRREDEKESRRRDRDRDRDRDRARERERDRDREKDRKRSRRDRSGSPADSDYSSRHHSRRTKRSHGDESRSGDKEKRPSADKDRNGDKSARPVEPEKDPHTLEREARNRERLLKEQQRREAMNTDRDSKASRRRENRHERSLAGGRRLSYKYEDEESDRARAARIEQEREASRWA